MRKIISLLKLDILIILATMLVQSLSRVVLCIINHDHFSSNLLVNNDFYYILLQGIRTDISVFCWFLGPVMCFQLLFSGRNLIGAIWNIVHKFMLALFFIVNSIFEITTPAFINEYGFRPNRLYYEYLKYPKQVYNMLVESHIMEICLSLVGIAIIIFIAWYILFKTKSATSSRNNGVSFFKRVIAFVILGAFVFIGARSSFDHRPFNPSMVAFSKDPLLNSLAINSANSLVFSVRKTFKTKSYDIYPNINPKDALKAVKKDFGLNDSDSIWHFQKALGETTEPLNVVIILEESLSAKFLEVLGGEKGVTPYLNNLYSDGWGFYNLYSTGIRSIRGIEATTSCFPPTINYAVVKRENAQRGFFNISQVYKELGYDTSFIYGGESHFDDMKTFFLGNGYNNIIDEGSYQNIKYHQSWGASDIDLFDKAHEYFMSMNKQHKNFYSLVFTSSNHIPFDVPVLDDLQYLDKEPTVIRGVQFADYAVGKFIEKAKQSPYWKNTIFMIVADHNSRIANNNMMPISSFHIPGIILGGVVAPYKDYRLMSQLDIVPTLLSLSGVDATIPCFGKDFNDKSKYDFNTIIMQNNYVFTYLDSNGNATILTAKDEEPYQENKFDFATQSFIDPVTDSNSVDGKLLDKESIAKRDKTRRLALSYANLGEYLYQQGLYLMKNKPNQLNKQNNIDDKKVPTDDN